MGGSLPETPRGGRVTDPTSLPAGRFFQDCNRCAGINLRVAPAGARSAGVSKTPHWPNWLLYRGIGLVRAFE